MEETKSGQNVVYGVDITKKVTPEMVKEAVVLCFSEAHKEVLDSYKDYTDFESEEEFNKLKEMDVRLIVKKAFLDTGGDFDKPTKDSLKAAIGWLANYARNFRDPKIIEKHYGEIMQLISALD